MDGQADEVGEGSVESVGTDDLGRRRRGVGGGRAERDGAGARVDSRDGRSGGEVRVDEGRADRESGDGGQLHGGRGGSDRGRREPTLAGRHGGQAGRGVKAERATVGKGAAGVLIGSEVRLQAERGTAEGDYARRSGDPRLHDGRVLVDEEIEVSVPAFGRRSARDGVGCALCEQTVRHVSVGHDAGSQRQIRTGGPAREGDVMFGPGKTPRVGDPGSGRHRAGGSVVVVVTRVGVARGDIGSSEADGIGLAHLGHAEGVGVAGEGVAGGDRPAADDAVDEIGGRVGGGIDLREEDVRVSGQSLLAQRVGSAGIPVRPADQVERGTVGRGADDIAHVDADGAADGDVGLRIEGVGTGLEIDAVEGDDGVGRARAAYLQGRALQGDRRSRRNAYRQRSGVRIESEVLEVDDAVEGTHRGGGGERAGILQQERAATDDRLTGVGAGVGQRGRVVAHADEVQLAREGSAEGSAAGRDQIDGGRAGVGDGARAARDAVGRGDRTEGLGLVLEVQDGVEGVDLQVGGDG